MNVKNPFSQPSNPLVMGILLALIAPALWSTSGLFIKILTLEPLPLTALRNLAAALMFLPLIRNRPARWDLNLVMLIVAYAAMGWTFVMGTKWTTAANAIALQSTSPAWVFFFLCVMERRVFWRLMPPILIILFGVTIIMGEPSTGTSMLGNLMGLISGVSFALTSLFGIESLFILSVKISLIYKL